MTLSDWLRNSWLQKHRTSREEIQGLLSVVDRSLQDAETPGLSLDGRFNQAYNAALQCAVAALAAEGFRLPGQSKHYRAIDSLALTLGETSENVRLLDAARKKRHVAVYERSGSITDVEVEEMMVYAKKLRSKLLNWLKENHQELSP
jgi:uncharacterized protein (UPF0332 family)